VKASRGDATVPCGFSAGACLIQSAWLDGHDPHAYLKDVLARPPT
jgi:hypothetical protein